MRREDAEGDAIKQGREAIKKAKGQRGKGEKRLQRRDFSTSTTREKKSERGCGVGQVKTGLKGRDLHG